MNDTPETVIIKDLIENLNLWSERYKGKPISLSLFRAVTILRELERERDEAKELADRMFRERAEALKEIHNQFVEYDKLFDEAEQIRIERDKAREKCANLGMAMSYSPVSTSLLSKFLQAIKERNETKLALCSLAKQFESDIQKANAMAEKAKALIDRWDKPSWKDTAPTAGFIYALRSAVEDYEKTLK